MQYQIIRQLGVGGFSEIFEVRDPSSALAEVLILKRLNSDLSARPEIRQALTREGEILRNLRHTNIVAFRGCFFDDGHVCLVMEKVEGENLQAWAQAKREDAWEVIDAFRKIVEAVDYLHHRPEPLLHLDLKPDNILMTRTPHGVQPVLIDFGISRSLGGSGLKAYTPPYAAPEQMRGGKLGCFTDVFALGQILDELLTTVSAGLQQEQLQRLWAVVGKARSPRRRERYAEAGDMLSALRTAWTPGPTTTVAMRIPGGRAAGTAAGLSLVAILGLATWSFVGRPGTPEFQGLDPLPAPSGEICFQPKGPDPDHSELQRLFEFCLEGALQSNDPRRMNSEFVAAQSYLHDPRNGLGVELRKELDQSLRNYKETIEWMTRTGTSGSSVGSHRRVWRR